MHIFRYLRPILLATLLSTAMPAYADISKTDLKLTQQALENIQNDKYKNAKTLIAEMRNGAAKQVALHALFRSRGYVTKPAEIASFIKTYPQWKGLTSLKSIMEKRIYRGQYSADYAAQWLANYPPRTSLGKLYQAEQLFAAQKTEQGLKLLRSVWRGYVLDENTEVRLLSKYKQHFDRWDHKLRADFLLRSNMTSAAIRNAGYAGSAYVKLYQARIALEKKKPDGLAKYKQVAKSLKKDMGLNYSLLTYFFKKRDELGALPFMERASGQTQNVVSKTAYWNLKFRMIHRLLARKHTQKSKKRAFKLLVKHQQSPKTVRFVDAEFKAGWVAYTKFNDYKLAQKHFTISQKKSNSKKHLSRIYYWQAQTARKLGDNSAYRNYLEKASKYKYSFYGQLASERIGENVFKIPTAPKATNAQTKLINASAHADFIKIYSYLGQNKQLKYHYNKLKVRAKKPSYIASLVKFAKSQNSRHFALEAARHGMIKGWDFQVDAYPNASLPKYEIYSGKVDKALSYGLIRQESLFDQYAKSHTGASGYMQITKATGAYLAKRYKVKDYKHSRLTSDAKLNLGLGNSYLYKLINDFDGSYVMAVSAYNGGGTWVKRWTELNGDPRINEVSFVNWIEGIPKAETRGYIKKVLKNMQIFEGRFQKNNVKTNLIGALVTGEK